MVSDAAYSTWFWMVMRYTRVSSYIYGVATSITARTTLAKDQIHRLSMVDCRQFMLINKWTSEIHHVNKWFIPKVWTLSNDLFQWSQHWRWSTPVPRGTWTCLIREVHHVGGAPWRLSHCSMLSPVAAQEWRPERSGFMIYSPVLVYIAGKSSNHHLHSGCGSSSAHFPVVHSITRVWAIWFARCHRTSCFIPGFSCGWPCERVLVRSVGLH